MPSYISRIAISMCLCLSAALASARSESDQPASWAEAGYFHQFQADVDDDGNFDVRGGFGRGQVILRLMDDVRMRTLGSYYGTSYEFDDPPTIAGSSFKPWNTIHVARLSPLIDVDVADRWTIFAGPLIELSMENGADLGNAVRFGGLIGTRYRVSSRLRIGLGVVGVSEIENDAYIQPLLLLDWTPTDRIRLHVSSWTTRGGKASIAFRASDEIEIAASLEYRRERFRLKERSLSTTPPPPVFRTGSKGIGEDRSLRPAVRLSYSPRARFIRDTVGAVRIDLEVGVAVAGDLRIESRNGDRIQTIGYDPAPTLSLAIGIPL